MERTRSSVSVKAASIESKSSKTDDKNKFEDLPLYAWDPAMVERWLINEDLKEYVPLFRDKEVDGETLLAMDYDSLKVMGITGVSDRSKILSAIKFTNRSCPYMPECANPPGSHRGNDRNDQDRSRRRDTSKGTGISGRLQLKKKIEERFPALQMLSNKLSTSKDSVLSRIVSSRSSKSSSSSSPQLPNTMGSLRRKTPSPTPSAYKSDSKKSHLSPGKCLGIANKSTSDLSIPRESMESATNSSDTNNKLSGNKSPVSIRSHPSANRPQNGTSSATCTIKIAQSNVEKCNTAKLSIKSMNMIEEPQISVRKLGKSSTLSQDHKTPTILEIPTFSPLTQTKSSESPISLTHLSLARSPLGTTSDKQSFQQRILANSDADIAMDVHRKSRNSPGEKSPPAGVAASRSDSLSSAAHLPFLLKSPGGATDQRNVINPVAVSPRRASPEQDPLQRVYPVVPNRSDSLASSFKHMESRRTSSSTKKGSQNGSPHTSGDDITAPPAVLRGVLAPQEQNVTNAAPERRSLRKFSAPLTRAAADILFPYRSRDEFDISTGPLSSWKPGGDLALDSLKEIPYINRSPLDSADEGRRSDTRGYSSADIYSRHKLQISNPQVSRPNNTPRTPSPAPTNDALKTIAQFTNSTPKDTTSSSQTPRSASEITRAGGSNALSNDITDENLTGPAKSPRGDSTDVQAEPGQSSRELAKSKASSLHLTTTSNSDLPLQAYISEDELGTKVHYIGERPPDELIVDHLERYFPGIEDELYTPTDDEQNQQIIAPKADPDGENETGDAKVKPDLPSAADSKYDADSYLPKNVGVMQKIDSDEFKNTNFKNDAEGADAFKLGDYSSKSDELKRDSTLNQDLPEMPIPKRNMDLEDAPQNRRRHTCRKSDIQNRAQSAIISKRISRLAKRRSGINPVRPITRVSSNFPNNNKDWAYKPPYPVSKPPDQPVSPKRDNYKINQRSSSIRMSKFNPRPLGFKDLQEANQNVFPARDPDAGNINPIRGPVAKPSVSRRVSPQRNIVLNDDALKLENLSIGQETFPLVAAKPVDPSKQQVYDIPTLKKERESPRTDNDDEGNDLKDVLSNMLEGYQNEASVNDAFSLVNEDDNVRVSEAAKKRVSLKVPDKISDLKTLDIYSAMKTYECTEKRNTLISSRFSSDARQNVPIGFKWRLGKVIGRGAFGTVYIGINLTSGDLMAVKQVDFGVETNATVSRRRRQEESIKREIGFLKELQHDHIVAYYGCASVDNTFNVFLEYVSGGSIASCLTKYGAFTDSCVRCFTAQILFGLEYLHSVNIIHRDIKGANVLVDSEGVAKISDFGISKRNQYNQAYHRVTRMSMQGTVPWMAPEVTRGKGYSAKVDIWSLGCLILEMLTNRNPWYKVKGSVIYLLGKGKAPPIPSNLSPEAKEFLAKCFNDNPELRPTATEILNNPNGYPDTQNPMSFDFKKWIAGVIHNRASDEKYYHNTYESTQSQTFNVA